MMANERDVAETLARVRHERAAAEAAERRRRLEAARIHEERIFAEADRFARRLLESVEQLGRLRTPPHYEAALTREARPLGEARDAIRGVARDDRRDAA